MILSSTAVDPNRALEPALDAGQAAIDTRMKTLGMSDLGDAREPVNGVAKGAAQ